MTENAIIVVIRRMQLFFLHKLVNSRNNFAYSASKIMPRRSKAVQAFRFYVY